MLKYAMHKCDASYVTQIRYSLERAHRIYIKIYLSRKDYESAETELGKYKKMIEKYRNCGNTDTVGNIASWKKYYAQYLMGTEKYEEAITLLKDAINMHLNSFSPYNGRYLTILRYMITCCICAGYIAEARMYENQALHIARVMYTTDHLYLLELERMVKNI